MIREEIGELLQREVSDPRLDFATITDVQVSADLREAHVYVTFLGKPEQQSENLEVLTKAGGFLRRQLGQRIRLRYIPNLTFHLDASMECGRRIDKVLEELEQSRSQSEE